MPTAPVAVAPPWTKPEIVAELGRVHEACDAFWNAFPIDEFLTPIGSAWSPADNVRHLVKSVRPVTLAFRLPRPLLALLFGRARRPSRRFDALCADYRAVLAAGGTAGRFAPAPLRVARDREAWRRDLMGVRAGVEAGLRAAVARWSDADLDAYRVPHPLLGKLTLREMLFFCLLHGVHHVEGVAKRKAGV